MKLQSGSAKEAKALAKEARGLLRQVKKSDGRIPKGYSLATFVEVKALIAKAKSQSGGFLAKNAESDASGHEGTDHDTSDDEQFQEVVLTHEEEERHSAAAAPAGADKKSIPTSTEAASTSAELLQNYQID